VRVYVRKLINVGATLTSWIHNGDEMIFVRLVLAPTLNL